MRLNVTYLMLRHTFNVSGLNERLKIILHYDRVCTGRICSSERGRIPFPPVFPVNLNSIAILVIGGTTTREWTLHARTVR